MVKKWWLNYIVFLFVFLFVFFFSEIFSWNHGFKKSFFTFNSEGYETVVCRFGVYIFHEFIVFNLIFTFLGVLSEILDNIEILKIAKKRNRKKVRTLIISCPIWLIFWCFVPYTDTKNGKLGYIWNINITYYSEKIEQQYLGFLEKKIFAVFGPQNWKR